MARLEMAKFTSFVSHAAMALDHLIKGPSVGKLVFFSFLCFNNPSRSGSRLASHATSSFREGAEKMHCRVNFLVMPIWYYPTSAAAGRYSAFG